MDFAQFRIEKLSPDHNRDDFDCGNDWPNKYILSHALANTALGYGRTYVAIRSGSSAIEGFYTVSMSSVMFANLPEELTARVPKYPMPVAHMGCLAVGLDSQGQGLGSILLIDAFRRVLAAAELVAARALDVLAIDENARQWYLRKGFMEFKDNRRHLYLPLETIR